MSRTTHGHDRQFKKGERGFNYYGMQWGTVTRDADEEGWFKFENDDGTTDLLNDERVVVESVAIRFGYPKDPA